MEKHTESNYFPWFIYVSFNDNLNFRLGSEKLMYKDLDKSFKGQMVDDKEFLENFLKKLDLVIEKWQNFPFLDEIYLKRGILGFFYGENDEKLIEIFKRSIEKSKHKETREIA